MNKTASVVPNISPKQIAQAIEQVLSSITDVDAVLSYKKDYANNIVGRFRSDKDVFDYLITPNDKVSFVTSTVRADAYLGGYYLPNIQLFDSDSDYFWAYASDKITRLDQKVASKKGKQCKIGKRCGTTCINKNLTCSNQSISPRQSQILAKVRSSIPSSPKVEINPALVAGIAATALGVAAAVAIAGGGETIATRSQSKGVKEDIPASPFAPVGGAAIATRSQSKGVKEDIPASPFAPVDDPWETPPLPPEEDAPYTGPSVTNAPQLPPARRKVGAKSVEVIRPVTSSEPPEEAISGTTRDRIRNRTDPVPPRNNLPLFPPIRGKSVRESVGVEGFDPDSTRKLESALDAVDKVLKVEGLHESTITPADTNGKYVAFYKPVWTRYAPPGQEVQYSDDKMGHIHIDPQVASQHGSFTSAALHEVAHAIDHQILGKDVAGFGSEKSPDFDEFKAIYQQTKAYKRIQKMKNSPIPEVKQRAEMADNPKEYFARAFEQYVARKSGSKSLQAQVKTHQNHRNSPYWDDSDFKQVEAALDKFFTQKGMR